MSSALRVAYSYEPCWHRVPGGTALSLLRTAEALHARDDVELVGFSARHGRDPEALFAPTTPVAQVPVPRRLLYELWHRVGWPKVEATTGPVDVIHGTGGVTPPRGAPLVVTLHDLAVERFPDHFSLNGRVFLRAALRRAASRADLVLCPSQATRADAVAFGFDPDRLRVVPWGVDDHQATDADVVAVRAKYGLPDDFILFVGTAEPRKNLAGALAGVQEFAARRGRPELPLVVAGPHGWGDAGLTEQRAVTVLGFVPQTELAALYRAAGVFLYPSLLEGFGMPVLEAMAQGTPVVTSAGTATEELVSRGGGVAVDPSEPTAIAAGIEAVVNDIDGLSTQAGAIAQSYRWSDTAELTVQAYREAVA